MDQASRAQHPRKHPSNCLFILTQEYCVIIQYTETNSHTESVTLRIQIDQSIDWSEFLSEGRKSVKGSLLTEHDSSSAIESKSVFPQCTTFHPYSPGLAKYESINNNEIPSSVVLANNEQICAISSMAKHQTFKVIWVDELCSRGGTRGVEASRAILRFEYRRCRLLTNVSLTLLREMKWVDSAVLPPSAWEFSLRFVEINAEYPSPIYQDTTLEDVVPDKALREKLIQKQDVDLSSLDFDFA
ncbi:hypothetical protein IQ07DRAFT_340379 [Pyrenochaeta sp. DS3sAY3a]|nr:hypothetical protein IQ07DRAFT_340379 [Pyrenochaeta sp. DS3sAY3a]